MQMTTTDDIRAGWTAVDTTGEKIGDVLEIGSNYALVKKGSFFPEDLYIPLSSVTSINPTETTFAVEVTSDEVDSLGWKNPPTDSSWDVPVPRVD